MILCVLKRILQFSCNYCNPQFLLLLLLPSGWSFTRGRSPLDDLFQEAGSSGSSFARGRPPLDDLFQEAGPSGSSFARGRPFRMTICKRPVPRDHHLQEAGPPFWQPRQGRENCIFDTLYNEKRCVLSVKESNINEKNQNFHICLRSGPRWLTPPFPTHPPHPYGQPDHKISVFLFDDFP